MERAIRATTVGFGAAAVLLAAVGCGGHSTTPAQRHLVYVHGSDPAKPSVWIADVNGGHSRRLTRGSVGVLSPDGRTVAVARGKGVYLVSANGKRVRRLTARQLRPRAWSPDGKTLIATAASSQAVVELIGLDRRSGRQNLIARGSLYGFDFSPGGDELVYSRAAETTAEGICGDQFDLYVSKLDGSSAKRLTHDGLSAFPVWGPLRIAFSHFPPGNSLADCSAPGLWTIKSDGSEMRPVIARAPDSMTLLAGYYGLQPLAWLDDKRVLVGLRTDSGTEGAVLDTRSHKLRLLNDYADEASRDGRFSVGGGGTQEVDLSILRLSDGHRIFRRKDSCCPDWNR